MIEQRQADEQMRGMARIRLTDRVIAWVETPRQRQIGMLLLTILVDQMTEEFARGLDRSEDPRRAAERHIEEHFAAGILPYLDGPIRQKWAGLLTRWRLWRMAGRVLRKIRQDPNSPRQIGGDPVTARELARAWTRGVAATRPDHLAELIAEAASNPRKAR